MANLMEQINWKNESNQAKKMEDQKNKKNANDKIFKNLYINNFGGDELN